MKKEYLLAICLLSLAIANAQDITDALRYSGDNIQGTARFRGLSGAFGALGGDMSAVNINPAGSAVFNTSHISLSLSNMQTKNETQFYNGLTSSKNSNIDLNQTGAAFIFNNRNTNSPWKKFAISVAYDKIQDYDNNWYAIGTNPNNSIDQYFLRYANGLRLDEISTLPNETYSEAYSEIGSLYGYGNQQGFLGYESFILEPVDNTDDNTQYTSNIGSGDYYQEYSYASTGYNGKFTVNAATQFGDRIYMGLNLNSHFINFEKSTFLYERNNNQGSTVSQVQFENNLFTTGSGFSFQLGTIIKITEQLRAGFAFNSPTWFNINEETSQYLRTIIDDNGNDASVTINPRVINIYPTYRLQTPGRISGSLAYVIGKYGLISFDYSLKDYSNTKFKPTSDLYFREQNDIINNNLTSASTFRIGGEAKINQLSIRGGYRFEESPYKDGTTVGDLTGYSVGLGYNFGNVIKLDVTFDQANQSNITQLYNVGLTDAANIDARNSNLTFTLSFNM